jgi:hypothetical protein
MFELDLSIRDCAREDTGGMNAECPRESHDHTKKRPSIQCVRETSPELKRLRFEIESAFEEPEDCSFARDSRPSTPPELLALRAAIEEEEESTPDKTRQTHPLPIPLPISFSRHPTSLRERWRHAGLMSDVGGIKEWLRVQRESKQTGVR